MEFPSTDELKYVGPTSLVYKGGFRGENVSVKYITFFRVDQIREFRAAEIASSVMPTPKQYFFMELGVLEIEDKGRSYRPLFCICSEWIEGKTLVAKLVANEPLDKRRIAMLLLDYIEKLNGRRVIHNDLHSHNIIIDDEGNLWIIDYGEAIIKYADAAIWEQALRYDESERKYDIWGLLDVFNDMYIGNDLWRNRQKEDDVMPFDYRETLDMSYEDELDHYRNKVDELF